MQYWWNRSLSSYIWSGKYIIINNVNLSESNSGRCSGKKMFRIAKDELETIFSKMADFETQSWLKMPNKFFLEFSLNVHCLVKVFQNFRNGYFYQTPVIAVSKSVQVKCSKETVFEQMYKNILYLVVIWLTNSIIIFRGVYHIKLPTRLK